MPIFMGCLFSMGAYYIEKSRFRTTRVELYYQATVTTLLNKDQVRTVLRYGVAN